MKENRKLLKEVLKDIRHDMTDEEVLNLLADSKISVSPESGKEKYTGAACSRCNCKICRELGIHFFFYWCPCSLDDRQCRAGIQGI